MVNRVIKTLDATYTGSKISNNLTVKTPSPLKKSIKHDKIKQRIISFFVVKSTVRQTLAAAFASSTSKTRLKT